MQTSPKKTLILVPVCISTEHIRAWALRAVWVKQLLHVTAHHVLLQPHQSPSGLPHLPKTNTHLCHGEGALLGRELPWRHRGSRAVCFPWSSSKGPTDLALAGVRVCVCVCLLKNQQGKCQTSILQLGERGGGAALASHLGSVGCVIFANMKNSSQASYKCQFSVFLRNASSSGQTMELGLTCTR